MPFYNSGSDFSNFSISFTDDPINDFGIFAKGYQLAAQRLSEMLLSAGNFREYEAYPIIFLYRHCFELYLKNIIYKAVALGQLKNIKNIDDRLTNNHNIKSLAGQVSHILRKLFPEDSSMQEFSDDVTTIANELSEIDPSSFSYRYPIDKMGNKSTKLKQTVNLNAFHSTMQKILEDCECIDFGFCLETYKEQEIKSLYSEIEDFMNS